MLTAYGTDNKKVYSSVYQKSTQTVSFGRWKTKKAKKPIQKKALKKCPQKQRAFEAVAGRFTFLFLVCG
ncbi:MAG: hypothetical protein K6A68_09510 [Clostridiales bacterium]|nr:hypothetical protein [Clostridiales bacterium]